MHKFWYFVWPSFRSHWPLRGPIGQNAGERSAQQYLDLFNQQWHQFQRSVDEQLQAEDRTLFSTMNISLEQIRKHNSAAASLKSFLAYLGTAGLVHELFEAAGGEGYECQADWFVVLTEPKIVFEKAMETLRNYSLIVYSPKEYSIHTRVHDWSAQVINENIQQNKY